MGYPGVPRVPPSDAWFFFLSIKHINTMSNAVVLTSNTAEFENFLSDTFSLRKNSEVCLSKAAISVPVEIHQFATIPVIPSADRANLAFTAAVDGLEHGIS